MKLSTHIKEAVTNLFTSKLRSILTLLGVLVGTASVVALISSGQLATEHALEQFKTLGTDLLAVSIQAAADQDENAPKLDLAGVQKIQNSNPQILLAAPYTTDYSFTAFKGNKLEATIVGATETLAEIIKIQLTAGRFVSYLDNTAYYCVIGYKIAQSLHSYGIINPLGQQILVGGNFFTVIGVIAEWPENMFMNADINETIIIPINTSLLLSKYVSIQNIIFKLQPDSDISSVESSITQTLNKIVPGSELFPRSAKQLVESMKNQSQTFTLLLSAIASISLIVGGIGVMNIMLVSVIERRQEIGIRMAIGAKKRDIQLMFLTEAIILTIFGGIIGIIIGVSVALIIALASHWTFHFFVMPPVIGFVVSVLVGIFFGYYPALKASQLDPIQTLRS